MRLRKIFQYLMAFATVSVVTVTAFAYASPVGDVTPSRAAQPSVRTTAIDVIARMRLLPTRNGELEDPSRYCHPSRMRVAWTPPHGTYQHGAYIEPLGPAPGATTTNVNGVVLCDGSTYAYAGFEAIRTSVGWNVLPVPEIDDDENDHTVPEPEGDKIDPGLKPRANPPAPLGKPDTSDGFPEPSSALTAGIEPYAPYNAQSSCSPSAKPGVLAFRTMMLKSNPHTRSLGITRACSAGGTSEHKEGRAWDWGARVDRPAERAEAEQVLDWLLASDERGNTHAMARRLGIMYIVWNRQIWGAYRAGDGWRSYHGANPHTDHVHFSFAWPGARAQTSFWTGKPVDMPGSMSAARGGVSTHTAKGPGMRRGREREHATDNRKRPERRREEWRRERENSERQDRNRDRDRRWWSPEPHPSASLDAEEKDVAPEVAPTPSRDVAPTPSPDAGDIDDRDRNRERRRDRWRKSRDRARPGWSRRRGHPQPDEQGGGRSDRWPGFAQR